MFVDHPSFLISVFRRGVSEIFAVPVWYAAYIGSYRRFGTTYPSHIKGSRSPRRIV